MMNQALIEKGGKDSIWFLPNVNPSGDGRVMEIIGQPGLGNGTNDLSQFINYDRSYVCKIPCSKGNKFIFSRVLKPN